jgi:methylmalonyl-CoA mutase
MLAYVNATNSSHSNAADEPFTTPSAEYARLASNAQAILLEESGLFKHTTNLFGSSPGMVALERAVQRAVLDEFRQIEDLGGVLAACEHRYQRSQIQAAAHRYERQIQGGQRPIVGLNAYRADGAAGRPDPKPVRTPLRQQRLQIARVKQFKRAHAGQAPRALDRLERVVTTGQNVFAELIQTVGHCTLGQITARLHEIVGHYRPTV